MRAFAFRVELDRLVTVDRLHHAYPGKDHRPVIFCGLSLTPALGRFLDIRKFWSRGTTAIAAVWWPLATVLVALAVAIVGIVFA